MSSIAELLHEHARVFERPEFRHDEPGARIRLVLEGDADWLASTESGRLVLAPARPGDAPAHMIVRVAATDLARHIEGGLDLLASARPRLAFEYPDHGLAQERALARPSLRHLALRILQMLALSRQCRAPFARGVVEELYLSDRSPRADGGEERLGNWSLPYGAGEILYRLVRANGLRDTLEIGMAHGLSSLFLAQGLAENGGGRHVAIDPWQTRGFGRAAVMNAERAGLGHLVELIEEPNFRALPRLVAEGGERFDLAFIDGLHLFDHVALDFFYCDLLVRVGGYVVLDDSLTPGVRPLLSFVLENRNDSYERVPELGSERITVLRKTASDVRVERYGVLFHRPFTSTAGEVEPLPAPRHGQLVKGAFDRVGALVALVVAAPLGLAIAAALVIEGLARGAGLASPIVGEPGISAGRPIRRLRFRATDARGAPSGVGRLTRKLGLATLPALANVLAGDMSLVGPTLTRPHEHVRRRLYADCGMRAGMTGFQDVRGEGSADAGLDYYDELVARRPLSLLGLDLSLLARAARRVFARKARRLVSPA